MNNKTLLAAALGIAVMGGVAYAAYNSINFSQNMGSQASSPQIIMPVTVDAGTNSTGTEFVQPAVADGTGSDSQLERCSSGRSDGLGCRQACNSSKAVRHHYGHRTDH